MPKTLIDVSDFRAVEVPVAADARTAESVEGPFQDLADRTRHNYNVLLANGLAGIGSPRRSVVLSAAESFSRGIGVSATKWTLDYATGPDTSLRQQSIKSGSGALSRVFPLHLPAGANLYLVGAGVRQGVTRATLTERPSIAVWREQSNLGTARITVLNYTYLTANTTNIEFVGAIINHTVVAGMAYYVEVSTGAGSTDDEIFGVDIQFDDPGPRNF